MINHPKLNGAPPLSFTCHPVHTCSFRGLSGFETVVRGTRGRGKDSASTFNRNTSDVGLDGVVISSFAPRTLVRTRGTGRQNVIIFISRVVNVFGSIGRCDGNRLVRRFLATCDKGTVSVAHYDVRVPVRVRVPYVGVVNATRPGQLLSLWWKLRKW